MYYKYCISVFCVLIWNCLFVEKDIILNAPTSCLKRLLWTADSVGRDAESQDFPKKQTAMQRKFQLN